MARGKGLVDTDIAMAVPAGTYGRIAPRSGLGGLIPMLEDDGGGGRWDGVGCCRATMGYGGLGMGMESGMLWRAIDG